MVGDAEGHINLFLNSGTDSDPTLTAGVKIHANGAEIQVSHYGWDGAFSFVVDWDNDRRKDLLVGDASGYVYLFLNSHTDSGPAFTSGKQIQAGGAPIHLAEAKNDGGPSHGFADPFVTDWNNDGRKDLLVGNWPGYAYLFINVGSDAVPEFASGERIQTKVSDAPAETLSPWVVDWDGDGRKDLIVGRHFGRVSVHINSGSDAAPEFTGRFDVETDEGAFISWDSDVSIVDWNNDGINDPIVGGRYGFVDLYLGSSP